MKIASLGECMLELASRSLDNYQLNFGGDTLNTAVYLARLGSNHPDNKVSYVTSLGTDPFSVNMLNSWKSESVDTSLVFQNPDKLPGLYTIQTDESGERSFYYWRSDSAAKLMFASQVDYFSALEDFDCIYLSGITLSLFTEHTLAAFIGFLQSYRGAGKLVAFDLNYRPANWPSAAAARERLAKFLPHVDIALPSFDDEQVLYGDGKVDTCIERYKSFGVQEVVLKNGIDGCYYLHNGELSHHPIETLIKPKDTTAAGDSFNAGFLHTRLNNTDARDDQRCSQAIRAGQACAAIVIQHPGAIVDADLFQR